MKQNKSQFRKAFTLIELLIVMFIFSMVMVMASSSLTMGFVSGRLNSTSSKDINRDVNSLFETIQLKMTTAQKGQIGNPPQTVYGFKKNGNVLAIISNAGTDALPATSNCTFFYLKNEAIYTTPGHSCDILYGNGDSALFTNRLTSSNIKITTFNFQSSYEYVSADKKAPYLNIDLVASDTGTRAEAEFNNTFTLNSLVVWSF